MKKLLFLILITITLSSGQCTLTIPSFSDLYYSSLLYLFKGSEKLNTFRRDVARTLEIGHYQGDPNEAFGNFLVNENALDNLSITKCLKLLKNYISLLEELITLQKTFPDAFSNHGNFENHIIEQITDARNSMREQLFDYTDIQYDCKLFRALLEENNTPFTACSVLLEDAQIFSYTILSKKTREHIKKIKHATQFISGMACSLALCFISYKYYQYLRKSLILSRTEALLKKIPLPTFIKN